VDRLTLERRQVWIYLAAIVAGLVLGTAVPEVEASAEVMIWSTLVLVVRDVHPGPAAPST
jgi:arsenite transporter